MRYQSGAVCRIPPETVGTDTAEAIDRSADKLTAETIDHNRNDHDRARHPRQETPSEARSLPLDFFALGMGQAMTCGREQLGHRRNYPVLRVLRFHNFALQGVNPVSFLR